MLQRAKTAYAEAIVDTDQERALAVVRQAVGCGVSPEDILFKVVMPTIEWMASLVNRNGEASLAQHFIAAQIAAEVTEEMLPKFRSAPQPIGRIVIGTSLGDFHGLGKRIVIGCLRPFLIDALDLGLSVPPERFVEEAVSQGAQVIGISSMMVHTARGGNGAVGVRQILRDRGLETRIKLIVGGAPYRFDRDLYRVVQADAWAEDGLQAGQVITRLIRETTP